MWNNIEISPKEYERTLNWHDGMLYCSILTIDNKNDWRLPTTEELKYIYDSENDFDGSSYWSSTEYSKYGNMDAWSRSMASGDHYFHLKSNRFYVRAVRSI